MRKVNPEMIVLARESRGITQVDLAKALSLNQTTISRYESGLIEVPDEHLAAIARFLGRPVSFFYWQERLYGSSCLYHRRYRRIQVSQLKMIHARVNILRMQAARLLQDAEVRSNYSFFRLDMDKYGGPEGCAQKLRQLWQLPTGPIRNVVGAIESARGVVFRCPFDGVRVEGISQWPLDDPDMPPVFFVREDVPGDRQRFTLGHEIGHVVMHHAPTEDPEGEANRFASEFLMPAAEIGPELSGLSLQKTAALKSAWKVSMQAIILWAKLLNKISEERFVSLYKQLSARGYRKCEPVPLPAEEPKMFRALLDMHRNALDWSIGELSERLGELSETFQAVYWQSLSGVRLVS